MAEAVDNAALRNAGIQGLREQIIDNAIIHFCKEVEHYQRSVYEQTKTYPKPAEAFKITTYGNNRRFQAYLVFGGGYPDGPAMNVLKSTGRNMSSRMKALEGLLEVFESSE